MTEQREKDGMICRACGRMADVDCAALEAPCLSAADDRGYEIDEAEVVYWGRCPDCAARASTAAPADLSTRRPRGRPKTPQD